MSILENMLLEELDRSQRMKAVVFGELKQLPVRCVYTRKVNKRIYYFHKEKTEDRTVCTYVPASKANVLMSQVSRREELKTSLIQIEKIYRCLNGH